METQSSAGCRSIRLSEECAARLRKARGYLLDWDGCCAVGNRLVPMARIFLRKNHTKSAIISNNSTHTAEEFAELLSHEKIPITADQIVLAGVEALCRAVELKPGRTLVLGNSSMRNLARNLGLRLVNDAADLVVVLRDTNLTYSRLERAVNSLGRGAHLIVANPDVTHPGVGGRIKPETGSILAFLRACVELLPTSCEVIGKPQSHLFFKGASAVGRSTSEVIMFGDNPETDIAGAVAMDMPAMLVHPSPNAFFEMVIKILDNA